MAATVSPLAGLSVAPDGQAYALPGPEEGERSFEAIRAVSERYRLAGKPVVVVQGLGFVGAAVAPVIADAGPDGPAHFVIGVDVATPEAFWKIARLNEGRFPFGSPDPALEPMTRRAVLDRGNLVATADERVYALADVIVVDLPLDAWSEPSGSADAPALRLAPFEAAIGAVGRQMRPGALVLVETTVPVGACERIVLPILQREFARRSIEAPVRLAHAYERVMPGPGYVRSIRSFWRVYSGIDADSAALARRFLEGFCEAERFPLRELETPAASEMAKLLENSYRAMNIAFIQEWTLLAEAAGVDLFQVIEAIRMRKGTHDNIRQPGFGVGGYCLTKDSLLAQWGAEHLFGSGIRLETSLEALRINARMPLHTLELLREVLDRDLAGKRIAVMGVAYLPDVPDERCTPTATLLSALAGTGAAATAHDPHLSAWTHPEARFEPRLDAALAGAHAVVLAVPHRAYLELTADDLLGLTGGPAAIVDAQNIIDDPTARALREAGCRVIGVGKGHWRRRSYHV